MSRLYSPLFVKISSIISNLFNPIISLSIFFIFYSFNNGLSKMENIIHFSFIFGIIILPIILWISWKVKTKQYTNADVSDRNQRKSLYFFIELMQFIYLIIYYLIKNELDIMVLFILILTIIMQWSNYFVKSSMHTAFNILVAFFFYSMEPIMGLIWAFIAAIVAFTRIVLKRHSLKEIIWGTIISIIISFAYLYTLTIYSTLS